MAHPRSKALRYINGKQVKLPVANKCMNINTELELVSIKNQFNCLKIIPLKPVTTLTNKIKSVNISTT